VIDLDNPAFARTAALVLIFAAMLAESMRSRRNTEALKLYGATEVSDPIWPVMAAVYPAAFVAMFIESTVRGGPTAAQFGIGLVLFNLAKLLKMSAIHALGIRWSFRVLVLPGEPLVAQGPYRWLRHPNYVAVIGELIAAAVMFAAPVTGVVFTLAFAEIIRRRIQVEERALGIRS
jgi:methyltransferase